MSNLRSEIKHNFLKQIMFRLDFEGVMEADIESCIVKLRKNFFEAGLKRMENRTENQFDFQLKMDLNVPNENSFSINNSSKSLVYSFYSEDNDEKLEISKSFFTFTVDINMIYKTFDKYVKLLAKTINTIKNSSVYFRAFRMGLRKINICFLKDMDILSKYFTNAAFNIDSVREKFEDFDCKASNIVTIMQKEGYQINYVRNIQEGVMQQADEEEYTTYQIVLDIDVYKEDNRAIAGEIISEDAIEQMLIKQNSIEFDVFIKSLTEELIELIKKSQFDNDEIKGVM